MDGPKPKEETPKKPRAPRKKKTAPQVEEDDGDQANPFDESVDKKRKGGVTEDAEGEKPVKKRGRPSNAGEKAGKMPLKVGS